MAVQCPECGWKFRDESGLETHRVRFHGREPSPPTGEPVSAAAEAGSTRPPPPAAAAAEPPPPSGDLPPAGWYPDPEGGKGTRYWTGTAWADRPGDAPPTWLLVLGYAGAVVFPIIGLIVGIVLLVQRRFTHGLAITLIALAFGTAGVIIQVNKDEGSIASSIERLVVPARVG